MEACPACWDPGFINPNTGHWQCGNAACEDPSDYEHVPGFRAALISEGDYADKNGLIWECVICRVRLRPPESCPLHETPSEACVACGDPGA